MFALDRLIEMCQYLQCGCSSGDCWFNALLTVNISKSVQNLLLVLHKSDSEKLYQNTQVKKNAILAGHCKHVQVFSANTFWKQQINAIKNDDMDEI